MHFETRRTPRFPFIAVAELIHIESAEQLACRLAEISLNGCYVDILDILSYW